MSAKDGHSVGGKARQQAGNPLRKNREHSHKKQ